MVNMEDFQGLDPDEQAYLIASAQSEAHGSYPEPEEKINIFRIFKHILITKDTTKAGNLDERELFAVRLAQHTSNFLKTMNYNLVSDYFNGKGEVILATSLSKKGAFLEALITQKKQLSTDKNKGEKKGWLKKKEKQD